MTLSSEEEPSVKSVSGPARHVGEADNRVRDSRGGSPCGENRCGIGECREGERTLSLSQERAKLTRTIFFILRSEVSSIEKYDAPRRMYFLISRPNFGGPFCGQAEMRPYSSCFPYLHQTEGSWLRPDGSTQSTCRGTRDLIVRRRSTDRGAPAVSGSPRTGRPHSVECPSLPISTRALCGSRRRSESERVSTAERRCLRRQQCRRR